jgi:hypothetical protein
MRRTHRFVEGLSIDPLDAELGVVLIGTLEHAHKLREVIVLDTNPTPVLERLQALLLNLKTRPSFTARTIEPAMYSNYRILKDRSGFRVSRVFYDHGRPDSTLQPELSLVQNVRDLKRTLRAMAKAAGRQIVPTHRVVPKR